MTLTLATIFNQRLITVIRNTPCQPSTRNRTLILMPYNQVGAHYFPSQAFPGPESYVAERFGAQLPDDAFQTDFKRFQISIKQYQKNATACSLVKTNHYTLDCHYSLYADDFIFGLSSTRINLLRNPSHYPDLRVFNKLPNSLTFHRFKCELKDFLFIIYFWRNFDI